MKNADENATKRDQTDDAKDDGKKAAKGVAKLPLDLIGYVWKYRWLRFFFVMWLVWFWALSMRPAHSQTLWFDNSRPTIPSGSVYANGEAITSGSAVEGQILSARMVRMEADSTRKAAGAATGAALGGLLGNSLGKGDGKKAGVLLGALLGGLAGQTTASKVLGQEGVELVVRTQRSVMTLVQAIEPADRFAPGQRVYLVSVRGNTRAIPMPEQSVGSHQSATSAA